MVKAIYIIICLCLLGTSALKCCEHKGRCSKEMSKRKLACDSNAQQRDDCDHHDPFGADALTDELVKKGCCQLTCHSLFSAKKFTCPAGYENPSEENREEKSADRSVDELERECCRKPKVSCYTLFKAKKFSCPSGHLKPTATYMNHDIHEDVESKSANELMGRCCRQQSVCYTKLAAKNLNCDGFGTMPGQNMLRCGSVSDVQAVPNPMIFRSNVVETKPHAYARPT